MEPNLAELALTTDRFGFIWNNMRMGQQTSRDKKVKNREVGALGELVAAEYLEKNGYTMIAHNFLRTYGEIDLVARGTKVEDGETVPVVHFVEVKTVTHETRQQLEWAVTHETWRPEELVHRFKLNQIRKAAEAWRLINNWNGEVQVDVAAIRMVPRERFATVNLIQNILLE